ncbi:putative gustatory receptor 28b [Artemia franciscana]|uniref:putative gustatory receptor 28b n=1 Tax=Artemia franciscana TaxID=6661 RepID=UPI0032D9F826
MVILTTFHSMTQWQRFFYQFTFVCLGFIIFLRIAVTAIVGDRLAEKAREPLRIIHEMDLTKYDSVVQMQLLMFCNQISTRQLHPTASGFFNLSKQMVCTVASILATYVIVLMQFKNSD